MSPTGSSTAMYSKLVLVTIALLATNSFAAEPASPPETAKTNAAEKKPAPAAPEAPAVQKMATDFAQQRKERLETEKRLQERLKLARTAEEKEKILAEMREQTQQRIEQQREVARQIREQMQRKREDSAAATTRP